MRNKQFQNDIGGYKGKGVCAKNDPHKAFVEKLKKQVSSDESSTEGAGGTGAADGDVCSEEIMKRLEAEFDGLFADLDDGDD